MAALQRALALPHVSHLPRAIADDLHLDVTGARQILLDVEIAVAERGGRLRAAASVGVVDLLGARDDPHATATSARHRLEDDGSSRTERGVKFLNLGGARRARSPLQDRHAAALGERSSAALVAQELEHLGARTDERDARRRAAPREVRVLGQEAVARVKRVAAGLARHGDQLLGVQVCARARTAKRPRFVRLGYVETASVVLGKHRHRAHADSRRGTQDADRDLSSVRDEQAGHVTRLPAAGLAALRASSSARKRPAYPLDRRSGSRRNSCGPAA